VVVTVDELIERLGDYPGETELVTWDDESQIVIALADLAPVRIGQFGLELTRDEEGKSALMLFNSAQSVETVLSTAREQQETLAALEDDPTLIHGRHSIGIDNS
jgi:hypothetical protein